MSALFNLRDTDNITTILLSLCLVSVILLILVVVLFYRAHVMKRRMDRFFGARSDRRNIEAMFYEIMDRLDIAESNVEYMHQYLTESMENIYEKFRYCFQKIGFVRYNPFDNMGGELSFVLALLDEDDNGVLINTIHSRESTYSYAKPISAMQCPYPLSGEETRALRMASDSSYPLTAPSKKER